jgi:hypothetical protein
LMQVLPISSFRLHQVRPVSLFGDACGKVPIESDVDYQTPNEFGNVWRFA